MLQEHLFLSSTKRKMKVFLKRKKGEVDRYHVIFSTYTEFRALFRLSPTFWTFWSISSIFVRAAYILNEIGSKLLIINNNNFITNDEDADQES